jgi:hypothetical protein
MLIFLSRGLGVGGTLEGLALRGPAVRNWCMGFWRPLARQGPTAQARLARSGCFDIRRERACWARIHRCESVYIGGSILLLSCLPRCPGRKCPVWCAAGPWGGTGRGRWCRPYRRRHQTSPQRVFLGAGDDVLRHTLGLGRGVAAFALVVHRLRWEQAAAGTV